MPNTDYSLPPHNVEIEKSILSGLLTAQEYDLVLKDEAGNVVWKWSDGQMFAQAAHERIVGTEWSVKVDVPWPTQEGNYTLQAWLTTATPQFAATAPVRVGNQP